MDDSDILEVRTLLSIEMLKKIQKDISNRLILKTEAELNLLLNQHIHGLLIGLLEFIKELPSL